ncbi:MAG TPA: VWA domain-containing protein [Candidatus Binataceae bacterium]|nr:VWA domain-containing protein [Candidatus Binataceae bacterium]
MNRWYKVRIRSNERGQILPMFVVLLPVLLLFVGLTLDLGMAYVTKSALSKAADAAALAAMKNIKQGQAVATALATDAFNANYAAFGGNSPAPSVSVAITTNAANNTVVNVNATAQLSTFFLGILPGFKTINVSTASQTTRPKLIMALVLDKSGSMNLNGGATALPPAVINFLSYFDDSSDQVASVSFSTVSSVDVSIRTGFTSPITSAVDSMNFGGTTFSQAGLSDGLAQINSVTVPAGENVVKVAVFFTDGWANTIEDTLNCPTATLLEVGGCSPPEQAVGWCGQNPPGYSFMSPTTGNNTSCGASTFPSQATGGTLPLSIANISNDALYRANLVATQMRSQGIVVYSIGLGNKISEQFLQQIANDPASSTYDGTKPIGEAVFAPTTADLTGVFQDIANKILLRISQ